MANTHGTANGDVFSGMTWLIIAIVVVLLGGARQCGSCLGIEYWQSDGPSPAMQEYQQRRDDHAQSMRCGETENPYKCMKAHGLIK